jgi:hypothetical protein
MTADAFMPVGKTSQAKRGPVVLQVQTEYASRPHPRVTTSILSNGQVLHKVEHKLKRTVQSEQDRAQAEALIQQQHSDVLAIIQLDAKIQQATPDKKPAATARQPDQEPLRSIRDRLAALQGFKHMYRLDAGGAFASENGAEQFRARFPEVFEGLQDVVEVFALDPGKPEGRQKGVCEIIPDTLYFVSDGKERFFVTVQAIGEEIDYEKAIKRIVIGSELSLLQRR